MAKIVYTIVENKNGITKERKLRIRHDVDYVFFVLLVLLHYLTVLGRIMSLYLTITHSLSILFV